MKKFVVLSLAAVVSLGLAACSKQEPVANETDANAVVARIEAAFEPEDELDDALYGVLAQYVAIGHLEPQAWHTGGK